MTNQNSHIRVIFVVIIIVAGVLYWLKNYQNNIDITTDVKTNTTIRATSVRVGTFFDGEDGYSLSIPSGNSSTCVWTYNGGNGAIPWSENTFAKSSTEKHSIYSGDFYNWGVTCIDDLGNHYVGIFPDIDT